jgi:hypothetical protein
MHSHTNDADDGGTPFTTSRGRLTSEGVRVVMHAKRFYATVSFIADTRLKDATDLGGSLLL